MTVQAHRPGLHVAFADDETVLDLEGIQGLWTVEQYLALTQHCHRPLEFTHGSIEVLPMPTERHQAILEFIFLSLRLFMERIGGKARFAPMRVRIAPEKFREPDIVLLCDAADPRRQDRYWLGADMVVEIVSPDNSDRDIKEKRADYAEAGIPEYWIVDPQAETITVLKLEVNRYVEAGTHTRGTSASSVLLAGFQISVDAVMDAN